MEGQTDGSPLLCPEMRGRQTCLQPLLASAVLTFPICVVGLVLVLKSETWHPKEEAFFFFFLLFSPMNFEWHELHSILKRDLRKYSLK